MSPELMALLQRSLLLTDEQVAAILKDPEELQALLDVVIGEEDNRPHPTYLASNPHITVKHST